MRAAHWHSQPVPPGANTALAEQMDEGVGDLGNGCPIECLVKGMVIN